MISPVDGAAWPLFMLIVASVVRPLILSRVIKRRAGVNSEEESSAGSKGFEFFLNDRGGTAPKYEMRESLNEKSIAILPVLVATICPDSCPEV